MNGHGDHESLANTHVIKAEFQYKVKPRLPNQFKAAEKDHVPFAVILGEDECK